MSEVTLSFLAKNPFLLHHIPDFFMEEADVFQIVYPF